MNSEYADSFYTEVTSVDLYVFDSNGKLDTIVSRMVAESLEIDLTDRPHGRYELLAWCGVKDNSNFTVNHAGVENPTIKDFTCLINSDGDGNLRKDVGKLFYGYLGNVDIADEAGRHEYTISLTKITRNAQIKLQSMSGATINASDFDITITDNNCLYAHDNLLIPDKSITYHPWELKNEPEGAVATFTLGRLMADHSDEAILTVRNIRNGNITLQIPFCKYLVLTRAFFERDSQTPVSDQEILDRLGDFSMTFFLDEQEDWAKQIVNIDNWRFVLND